MFNNMNFDSSYEIALYIWLSDMGVDVEYEPDVIIKYETSGKQHFYFPDFRVEGQLLEVKGDHFFRPDGTMFCPFRNHDWTDEQYEIVCHAFEDKHQCMIRNNVYIMKTSSPDIVEAIKFVETKYGKHFISSLRTNVDE